jgi:hypothetical protein
LVWEAARPLLPEYPPLDGEERSRVERDVEAFLGAQIGSTPAHLRLPVRVALIGLELLPLARWGRRFSALDLGTRRAILQRWGSSRLRPKRDLVRLIRSCVLFGYLDHEGVRARLEAADEGRPAVGLSRAR